MPTTLHPLSALSPGTTATVAELRVSNESRRRLMELGLVANTPVEILRFALLGDPVEIKVRGYNLSLPRQEAEQIWVNVSAGA
jgi:ferrous iron transport protein A